jgi:hypothetical protein
MKLPVGEVGGEVAAGPAVDDGVAVAPGTGDGPGVEGAEVGPVVGLGSAKAQERGLPGVTSSGGGSAMHAGSSCV